MKSVTKSLLLWLIAFGSGTVLGQKDFDLEWFLILLLASIVFNFVHFGFNAED